MFKIRLIRRKEEAVLIAIGVGFLLLFVVNLVFTVPSLAAAFLPAQKRSEVPAIDTDTIERAIQIIHGE